ncbi:synaptotagmin-3 isoform X1 [Mercurialis annua]|uniref:synaptotagmin-3 isoform X1 n=2 Tax=Mercurialis annua TaxID=3986 RepID=UPI00215FF400|nr:synaptotagmin-3 isoform X1 [Mercurialis annua]XP_050211192.1 synaptotagmin-3 isoform X1 [Mercurialis annua]XP_050211193.1 synaptotagmin-3 isoform X1 [Mercurialis annua]
MGLLSSLLGFLGFGFGLPIGLVLGFFFFIYSRPHHHHRDHVKDPVIRPLHEMDMSSLEEILSEIPLWVKCPDYERVDWLNKFLLDMWPYLDKAICATIRSTTEPIFAEYIGKYKIQAIEFEHLSLGTLPPIIHGIKVYQTNEKDLLMEPAIKWAGNPNIILMLKIMSIPIRVQLVDLQVFAAPRVALKPLVPTFPCFANLVVSLMERPHVDFGLKILGGDVMSIPGLYRLVQEIIKKQVASLYLWPRSLDIPVLDSSSVAIKKPVGILHAKVVRAMKLLKADLLGTSDPYVKLSLTGEKLPAKKTTIKKKNLNPEWNENFKIIVKDPQSQVLHLEVFDWDKVGGHDRLGMQMVPLKVLTPYETKKLTLDLLKHTDLSDPQDKKRRGQIMVELNFVPFKQDSAKFIYPVDGGSEKSSDEQLSGAGLLSVIVQGAEDVEGEHHNNPFAFVHFRGEKKKTKMIRKTRDPRWNEEFQFTLDQPPLHDKIRIDVVSKRTRFSFRSKESLGHVEINLNDVVHNGRINEKYHLIDSKHGVIHVEIRWDTV